MPKSRKADVHWVWVGGYVQGVPPPPTDTKWRPPNVRSASGWYASYWNAVLFQVILTSTDHTD